MRVLAIDYGQRRIGLAISDETQLIAQPLSTIVYSGDWSGPLNKILEILGQYDICSIVIGLPKNMNGTIGTSGKKTIEFKEFIKKGIDNSNVEIVSWDERLSTVSAIKTISDIGIKRSKRKGLVDQMAAVYILQSYLDNIGFARTNKN